MQWSGKIESRSDGRRWMATPSQQHKTHLMTAIWIDLNLSLKHNISEQAPAIVLALIQAISRAPFTWDGKYGASMFLCVIHFMLLVFSLCFRIWWWGHGWKGTWRQEMLMRRCSGRSIRCWPKHIYIHLSPHVSLQMSHMGFKSEKNASPSHVLAICLSSSSWFQVFGVI